MIAQSAKKHSVSAIIKPRVKALCSVEGQSGGKCLTFTLDNWFVILSRFEIVCLNVNSCTECDF